MLQLNPEEEQEIVEILLDSRAHARITQNRRLVRSIDKGLETMGWIPSHD